MKRVILLRSNPVTPDPPVEKAALALLNAGYHVRILGWDRDADYGIKKELLQISDYEVEVIRLGIKAQFSGGIKKNLIPLCRFLAHLRAWLIKNRRTYDIVHAFDFDTGLVASRYAKLFHKKFVYHILDYYVASHDLRKTVLEKPICKLENSVINGADATIICSEKRREQIAGSRPKRLTVIHNTPSASQLKQYENKTQQTGRVKIVYVGILEPSRLLREIAAAVSETSKLEFHVAGFGTLEAFFVEQAQIYDNIYFYGRLTYDHTLSLENECDIMLAIYDPTIDNHRFAAPNKFYESLMLGKPVIMVYDTGMSEVVAENGIGERIEFSKEGFIDGVNRLLKRKEEWPLIGDRMKEIYRDQYCWDEMARRLIQMYAELQNEENTDR